MTNYFFLLEMGKKLFFLLAGIIFAFIACFTLFMRAQDSINSALENHKEFKRNYKSINLKKVNEFDVLVDAVDMKFFNFHIYVYDFEKQQILKFDSKGNAVQSFGRKGSGPGEFIQIMGWDVNSLGVSCADIGNFSISEINDKGEMFNYFKFDKTFSTSARLSENLYLMNGISYAKERIPKAPATSIFWLFNTKDQTKTEIPFLLPEPMAVPELEYEGFFVTQLESEKCFFVCKRFGCFFAFDKAGKLIYTAKTIDNSPPPKILVSEGGSATYDSKSPYVNFSASSTGKHLFVLSLIYEAGTDARSRGRIIDIYDINDGRYLWSFELPKIDNSKASKIAVTENQIFAYYGEKIVVFTYSE